MRAVDAEAEAAEGAVGPVVEGDRREDADPQTASEVQTEVEAGEEGDNHHLLSITLVVRLTGEGQGAIICARVERHLCEGKRHFINCPTSGFEGIFAPCR